jgi:hypothetical protein
MSTFASILILLAVAAIGLVVVSVANHLHTQEQQLRHRSMQFRRRVTELEEIVLTLDPLVASLAIPKLINEENLALTRKALELEPESETLRAHLERAEALAEDYDNESRPRETNRLLESDSAIARAKYYINEAVNILRRQHIRGELESERLDLFVSELAWAHLMVQVISMIGQGHKAMRRANHLSAYAFYRKAQQTLIDTIHSDARRHPMIRELSEILSGTRTALSEHLMPETYYNPAPTTSPSSNQASSGSQSA